MASDSKRGSKNHRLFHWPGLIEHYRRFLPVTDSMPIVTLNEGNTPLIEAPAIAERLGLNIKVYFKFEGANPTGRSHVAKIAESCHGIDREREE